MAERDDAQGRELWEAEKAAFAALAKLSACYYQHDFVDCAMVALHMAQHVACGLEPERDDSEDLPKADFSGKTEKKSDPNVS